MAFVLFDEGALVALLPDRSPMHPWAMTAPLDLAGLAVGDPVRSAGGELSVGAVRISVGPAEIADLTLADRPRVLTTENELVTRLAGQAGATLGGEGAWGEPLARFRAGEEASTLMRLLGVGRGLTPSGDDALVGVLAALDWAQDACPEAAGLREGIVPWVLLRAPRRTTRLSAQLLVAAAAGRYAEPVLDLLGSIVGEDASPARLEGAAASLLAMGHESGSATLQGIVSALGRLLSRRSQASRRSRARPTRRC